jgi:hypothetical protein
VTKGTPVTDAEAIIEREAEGYAAIDLGDAERLRELLHPTFIARTVDGQTLDGEEWISRVMLNTRDGIRLTPHEPTMTVTETRAVVHRKVSILSEADYAPGLGFVEYETIYEKHEGHWCIVANIARPA